MIHLYFCRHGESLAQAEDRWGGQNDAPLTDLGRTQAHEAGIELKGQGTPIDVIICSPLSRAHDTALIIAEEIGFPVDQIIVDPLFQERTFGVYDGQRRTPNWVDEHTYKELDDIEGAETIEKLQQRAARGLAVLQSRPESNVLLVAHGALGRGLIRTIKGEPYTNEFTLGKDIMNIIPNAKVIQLI